VLKWYFLGTAVLFKYSQGGHFCRAKQFSTSVSVKYTDEDDVSSGETVTSCHDSSLSRSNYVTQILQSSLELN